jgi:hypothetical protein
VVRLNGRVESKKQPSRCGDEGFYSGGKSELVLQ